VTDTHRDVLVVPRSALVAEGRRWHLFRVRTTGEVPRAELIEVERGFEEGDRVEILPPAQADPPLHEGDRIVVTGASSLSDGSTLEIVDSAREVAGASPRNAPTIEERCVAS
jgi:hypothetical protein